MVVLVEPSVTVTTYEIVPGGVGGIVGTSAEARVTVTVRPEAVAETRGSGLLTLKVAVPDGPPSTETEPD